MLWRARFLREPNAEQNKMPLFFYLPIIVWMGMVEAACEELCPAPVEARSRGRHFADTHIRQ